MRRFSVFAVIVLIIGVVAGATASARPAFDKKPAPAAKKGKQKQLGPICRDGKDYRSASLSLPDGTRGGNIGYIKIQLPADLSLSSTSALVQWSTKNRRVVMDKVVLELSDGWDALGYPTHESRQRIPSGPRGGSATISVVKGWHNDVFFCAHLQKR